MTMDTDELAAARIAAEDARAKLIRSAQALQVRLSPSTLARDAWQGAKDKSAHLAEKSVDAMRDRPGAAMGIAAALAFFLARKPIGQFAGRMFGSDDDEIQDQETEIA